MATYQEITSAIHQLERANNPPLILSMCKEGVETMQAETDKNWPDPTAEMIRSKDFNAVWAAIKTWDINVPEVDGDLYSGATGNHARAILEALERSKDVTLPA